MIFYLDIETIPTKEDDIIEEIEKSIKPPATHKTEQAINKWLFDNKESKIQELIHKTGLDGLYGEIACICCAIDDGEIVIFEMSQKCEYDMLEDFNDFVLAEVNDHAKFCGHNIYGFDLPFIKHRMMTNRVNPALVLQNAFTAKKWDAIIADTMLMWSEDRQRQVSMDKLCRAFGIEGKGDFDGSKVAETWPRDPKKVIDYCVSDVDRTRQIYKIMTFNF